jgi:hypothetical protein
MVNLHKLANAPVQRPGLSNDLELPKTTDVSPAGCNGG